MTPQPDHLPAPDKAVTGAERFRSVRQSTVALCRTLKPEDHVVQSMPSASPTKWHLAHTTWFFEAFVLSRCCDDYRVFHADYDFLFNSYYYTHGRMHARAQRGLLSRPTVAEILAYRDFIDQAVLELLTRDCDPEADFLIELGLNHEQQHQELMLTDIKHVFSVSPLQPAFLDSVIPASSRSAGDLVFIDYPGGTHRIGSTGEDFCFDNETPRHTVLLHDYQLANRTVTNREYRSFIDAGGYRKNELWLADGWAWLQSEGIDRPMYWSKDLESEFTLGGVQAINPDAPVTHVSFYEAAAFAQFAGARLPTEAEWESAATLPVDGHFMDRGVFHPQAAGDGIAAKDIKQMFGDVWEWTASPYAAYPGFRPLAGSLGEYNGKFMCNQMVCRGGSCVTPAGHVRASYRNFFYPHERWQFFGIRLARDL